MPKSTPARKTTPARKSSSRKPVLYGAGVVLAAALLGYVSYQATAPDHSDPSSSSVADVAADPDAGVYPELAKLARRDAGDKLAQGRADAPVVLIEYADFKCGYCGKFARDTEPALVKKYVDNGTLRIEWRNFPIFGAESEAAARAAWAAGQQNRFWQFHAAAYAEGAKEKGFGKDRLKVLAREAGVADLDRFARDADSSAASAAVSKDQEQGYGIGATSTPSFLINGRPIAGAQPAETFTRAIEAAAEKARNTEDAKSGRGADSGKNAEGAEDAAK
ncbi:DsbA family protein [Streptomyces sp. NBC_00257]|uniref:DsbA family protein n=1 Tax=unclassified Streptomyces TaxID=2593676 RepID=UPI002256A095|nr:MULTISPECIES: thioredoxin domain-containing protein [unclassified Streptomyces]WTB55662.1 DsbA family protein [Streptomyces sp. NBC_00826]WTH91455.1 DsbA family protein [Streptomyces sp. NBC_00825]WTI00183.1 DsbA family protein [Streptomyces sp. NBC_00822]MCX4865675.1 DsbA family protein [Streptomyces sp. NBC_00906]MCX4896914.1 DsbA family protein [Streptomyces sp. NBC_00892]